MRMWAAIVAAVSFFGCAPGDGTQNKVDSPSTDSEGRKQPVAKPIELTEANFQKEVTSGPLVIVDFWAPWCAPCRQMTPIMDRIAEKYDGRVKVCKLNVDESPMVAVKYDVMSIPRVLFFKGSEKPLHEEVGVQTETELVKLINQYK
jgi:thioredoxin 1